MACRVRTRCSIGHNTHSPRVFHRPEYARTWNVGSGICLDKHGVDDFELAGEPGCIAECLFENNFDSLKLVPVVRVDGRDTHMEWLLCGAAVGREPVVLVRVAVLMEK